MCSLYWTGDFYSISTNLLFTNSRLGIHYALLDSRPSRMLGWGRGSEAANFSVTIQIPSCNSQLVTLPRWLWENTFALGCWSRTQSLNDTYERNQIEKAGIHITQTCSHSCNPGRQDWIPWGPGEVKTPGKVVCARPMGAQPRNWLEIPPSKESRTCPTVVSPEEWHSWQYISYFVSK